MVTVNASQYGADWAGLVKERDYAKENLVKRGYIPPSERNIKPFELY